MEFVFVTWGFSFRNTLGSIIWIWMREVVLHFEFKQGEVGFELKFVLNKAASVTSGTDDADIFKLAVLL